MLFRSPFLEAGSSYTGSYDRLIPRDGIAAAGLAGMGRFPGPAAGFTEQVFLFRARSDGRGRAHQLLASADRGLAAHVSFRADTLPYAILWKRCAAVEEGYVAGLNPCSDLPNTRSVERQGGRLARIAPGAETVFDVSIEFLEGRRRVEDAAAEIDTIGADAAAAEVGRPADFDWLSRT